MAQQATSRKLNLDERLAIPVPLSNLRLDAENPRFGGITGGSAQEQVLAHIVDTFGVNDVLSSLAVNGYFKAEPLVGFRDKPTDPVVVAEGNRRLAACLMLTGEKRASAYADRARAYQQMWKKNGRPTVDPVPVIIFEGPNQRDSLLAYLGVRHIASAQPWDSYAKAAWVARVVEGSGFTVNDVAMMIGDEHQTIKRLLEGHYFVEQAIESSQFEPSNSVRKGRGSVTAYPFSWIYTILGYAAVRKYLAFREGDPKKNPISKDRLPHIAVLMDALVGNRAKGRNSAIDDSRDIGDLAAIFSDPDKVALLEDGASVREIVQRTRPIEERVRQSLSRVRTIQTSLVQGLTEQPLDSATAESLINLAEINRRTAVEIDKRIRAAAFGEDDD